MRSTGKRITIVSGIIAVITLGWAGITFKDRAVEQWYIWKLDSTDQRDRQIASRWLGERRSIRAVPKIIEALRKETSHPSIYRMPLAQIGLPAVPSLAGALKDPYWIVRWSAAVALGRIDPIARESFPALREALKDDNYFVRSAAASALFEKNRSPDHEGMQVLADRLKERKHRQEAARMLGKIGQPARELLPSLRDALADEPESLAVDFFRVSPLEEAIDTIEGRAP